MPVGMAFAVARQIGGDGSSASYTPAVQTEAATSVTATSAVLHSDIASEGYDVTDYGFLWGASASSLTNKLDVGDNVYFTATLSSLTDGMTYYFEAYATNMHGTADGDVLNFTTGVQTPTPTVQTENAASVAADSAVLNGDIASEGYNVTDYGFLWGTSASSLINKLDVGDNDYFGNFTATLSSLNDSTTYYFEAYATNWVGTRNGEALNFTTEIQTPTASKGTVFSDVPASLLGYNIITNLSTRGVVSGCPDGTFRPDAFITRAEFATMLVNALGLSITGTTSTFTDVAQCSWLYGPVNTAAAAGLVSGMGNNQCGPYSLITREQMAVMVARAMGNRAPAVDGTELNAFSDRSSVSSWAVTGMEVAVKAGIISGMTTDTLSPLDNATRAQAAAVIYQMLVFLGK
jgi:FlaG/FlaF family flagellin (archaellin)